ncbi:MAG: MFS transporter [Anaerolineae bacterium]|nr:MFS transporter [Anaerolineae bacterium]
MGTRRLGARIGVRAGDTFSALRYPNYRLWFFGQMISLFGTWMQSTAQGYLVYELTASARYLGYVSFASGVPTWLLMLYAGVVADRVPRRTLLVITQTGMMVLAFVLSALTMLGLVQPWHIVILSALLGACNAFDAPARQAFVLEMVEREDLTNAIALNSAMFNVATVLGPAVGGLVYARFGPAWCFAINGATFLAVIAALVAMRLKPLPRRPTQGGVLAELQEGLRYVAKHPTIRMLVTLVAAVTLFCISFGTLIPAWAVRILGGDARTNGLLMSARGVGALIGALLIASLGRPRFRGKLLSIGSLAFPLGLIAFSMVRWLPLSLLTLLGVGTAQIMVMNLANSLVQTEAADELRGRVMAIYSLVFLGLMPVGGLIVGAVAQEIGAPATVVLSALVGVACAVAIQLRMPWLSKLR